VSDYIASPYLKNARRISGEYLRAAAKLSAAALKLLAANAFSPSEKKSVLLIEAKTGTARLMLNAHKKTTSKLQRCNTTCLQKIIIYKAYRQ